MNAKKVGAAVSFSVGAGTIGFALYRLFTKGAAAGARIITLTQFEDASGNVITSIPSGQVFYAVGYLYENGLPVTNHAVYIYRATDASGNLVLPYERVSGVTAADGKFRIPLSYSVSATTNLWFVAYDAEQAPT